MAVRTVELMHFLLGSAARFYGDGDSLEHGFILGDYSAESGIMFRIWYLGLQPLR